jgi:hypothetical protein
MSVDVHTIEVQDGSNTLSTQDRVKVYAAQVANSAGGGAGQVVTVAVTFSQPMPSAGYSTFFDAGQDAVCFATSKTVNGFTLNINPRLAANTVAAGNVNLLVVA